jgi:hypothetical protein
MKPGKCTLLTGGTQAQQLCSIVHATLPLPSLLRSTALVRCKHSQALSDEIGSPYWDGL